MQCSKIKNDEIRLKQIIINLVSNSIKFTHQGSITVEAELLRETLVVKVIDTGCGIKASEKDKLFSLFGKLEDTTGSNRTGVGLGLAIS